MTHTAEISRTNPTCFVILIDQSSSMNEVIAGRNGQRKSELVAEELNRLLSELSVRCARGEEIRDFFHVAVIGYGATVGSVFGGLLADGELVPISVVAEHPLRVEERRRQVTDASGSVIERPYKLACWVDPVANGHTPMTEAMEIAHDIVEEFIGRYPGCFPPVVLNLTDGASTDGDPADAADAIRALASLDGNVLLFNLHISASGGQAIAFPDEDTALPDGYAHALFEMSSELPFSMRMYAVELGHPVSHRSRGFVYNADASSLVQFLDIGTRPPTIR